MKRQVIPIPIYNHKVVFLQGNLDNVLTYLSCIYNRDLQNMDVDYGAASALCFNLDDDIFVWCNNSCDIAVLGHELIHATYFIIQSRGLNVRDQETFCYI